MGTRNLTIVKLNGEVRVAQYGQWEGYPTGNGAKIAKFIQSSLDLRTFKANVRKLTWVTDEELNDAVVECGGERDSEWMSMGVAGKFKENYPEYDRDTGPAILALIQRGMVTSLQNSISFLKDGLFCEYAYVIDLDKKTVTVLVGGNHKVRTYKFSEFTVKAMKDLEKFLSEGDAA